MLLLVCRRKPTQTQGKHTHRKCPACMTPKPFKCGSCRNGTAYYIYYICLPARWHSVGKQMKMNDEIRCTVFDFFIVSASKVICSSVIGLNASLTICNNHPCFTHPPEKDYWRIAGNICCVLSVFIVYLRWSYTCASECSRPDVRVS